MTEETAEEQEDLTPWTVKLATDLRKMANWLETVDIPTPGYHGALFFHYYASTEGVKEALTTLLKVCDAKVKKYDVAFSKTFDTFEVRFDISRDAICTKEEVETIKLRPGTTASIENGMIVIEKWHCPDELVGKLATM